MRRVLPIGAARSSAFIAPRKVRKTLIDFAALGLPEDVCLNLAEAFWSHFGVQCERSICTAWSNVKTFGRFSGETGAVSRLTDVNGGMLLRYIQWLNTQKKLDGTPWATIVQAIAYTTLQNLVQWLQRCRPGIVGIVEYPLNPFPWRNRDTKSRSKIPARELRAILRACEADISQLRANREAARQQCNVDSGMPGTLGWVLTYIDRHCGGILPSRLQRSAADWHPINTAIAQLGGNSQVESCLYPRGEQLLPYYLAFIIHTAGNPDPIAEMHRDCLQSIPLLEDCQALLWFKARANSMQRRTFSRLDKFEPPALVKEIIDWNDRLLPLAPAALRDRLFLYKGLHGITAMTSSAATKLLVAFCKRHGLRRFCLSSIRPGVLAGFYRASGDLRRVAAVANHAQLSTTVRYVLTPELDALHRTRIAELQNAFLGHIQRHRVGGSEPSAKTKSTSIPPRPVVSMFGFNCADPYAGKAPGSQRGELCTNFMGCFTCPNAVIPADPTTLARLLHARDHLRAASSLLHPARWQAVYAPQLRILEEDILPRFSASELAAAEPLRSQLAPMLELR